MFRTVFLKTLFEKRWMTLWWSLSSIILVLFIVIFFPTLSQSFGESLKNVPDSMKSLIGDASDYQALGPYINIQVFQQMVYLPVILAVILCTGLIGGDESEGTLQTLLTYPVSRSKIYFHKLFASTVIVGVVTSTLFIGSWLGSLLINRDLDLWKTFQATVLIWLLSMSVGLLGFALSAMNGKRAVAGSIAGAYFFAMFIITSLVATVKGLRLAERFSPMHYYMNPSPFKGEFSFTNAGILLAACVVLSLVGYVFFVKRDVYQR